jgi:uncharacterized membrane protein affecting hemolysin expression
MRGRGRRRRWRTEESRLCEHVVFIMCICETRLLLSLRVTLSEEPLCKSVKKKKKKKEEEKKKHKID